jgi:hypothetical protein
MVLSHDFLIFKLNLEDGQPETIDAWAQALRNIYILTITKGLMIAFGIASF